MGHRGLALLLATVIGLPVQTARLEAAGPVNQILSDGDLYNLTVGDLKDRLARQERFTLLPGTIGGMSVSPDRDPVFWMEYNGEGTTNLDAVIATYRRSQGTFRLLRDGEIIGVSESEVVLKAYDAHGERKCAVVTDASARRFELPLRHGEGRALHTQAGWWALFDSGRVRTDQTPGSDPDLYGVTGVIEGQGEVILTIRPEGIMRDSATPLTIMVVDRNGVHKEEFNELSHMSTGWQGVLRARNGRWLAMGRRMILLGKDTPAEPTSEWERAALDAAKAGNRAEFEKALEDITIYFPDQLRKFCGELAALPDAVPGGKQLEEAAASELESLRAWHPVENMSADAEKKVRAEIAAYEEKVEEFLRHVQEARAGKLGITPERAAELIRGNFQFFNGRWIRNARVIRQTSASEALLQVTFLDDKFREREGVFRLDLGARSRVPGRPDLRLKIEGEFDALESLEKQDPLEPGPSCRSIVLPGGEELLFFPGRGLARMANGNLLWVDRSARFKLMRTALGCDKYGRIFFGSYQETQTSPWMPRKFDYWVYRPLTFWPQTVARVPAVVTRLYPVTSRPLMDASNGIWFVALDPPRFVATNVLGSLTDGAEVQSAIDDMTQASARRTEITNMRPGRVEYRRDLNARLYCREGNDCAVRLTNLPPDTILLNGRHGAVFGMSRRREPLGAFWIQGSSILVASNMHALAEVEFERLSKAAPLQGTSPSNFLPARAGWYPPACNPAFFLSGDALWIDQDECIEAYRAGQPQGVQTRLTLLNCPAETAALLGPMQTKAGVAQAIVGSGESDSSNVFWAYSGANGIDLRLGRIAVRSGLDAAPVDSLARGSLYSAHRNEVVELSGPTNQVTYPEAGPPALVTGNGNLIARTTRANYRGYRICSVQGGRDLPLTFLRQIRILNETEDGQLLCASPEGLLWLGLDRKGDYMLKREMRLELGGQIHSVTGETRECLYLTLLDATSQPYLAVIEKSGDAR